MKIVSWNINGLQAALKRGSLNQLAKLNFDILCFQEIKTQIEQIQLPIELQWLANYYSYFNCASKKGYSGVAVFTKEKPLKVEKILGFNRFDSEGRLLRLSFPKFTLINLYLTHGGRDKSKLNYKLRTYNSLLKYLTKVLRQAQDKLILVGDFNIAHQEIDLARPKDNRNNIMFTPEERKQIDRLLGLGFIDSFRHFNKKGSYYTWWPYRLNARQRNLGWRLDYGFISKTLTPKLKKAYILKEISGSDHCPIKVDINI